MIDKKLENIVSKELASKEDLMTMINLMNPKYYFPIRGEYKDQVLNAEIGELSGIPKENILLNLVISLLQL